MLKYSIQINSIYDQASQYLYCIEWIDCVIGRIGRPAYVVITPWVAELFLNIGGWAIQRVWVFDNDGVAYQATSSFDNKALIEYTFPACSSNFLSSRFFEKPTINKIVCFGKHETAILELC